MKRNPWQFRVEPASVVLASAILINSVVLFVGLGRVANLTAAVRFGMLVASPQGASAVAGASSSVTDARTVRVELFSDFDCPHCRTSARVVDSLQTVFGDSVQWIYRHFANVRRDLSLRSAVAAECLGHGNPWEVYDVLSSITPWSRHSLDSALAVLAIDTAELNDCMQADSSVTRVWHDVFEAAARGLAATPTVIVDGIRVRGRLTFDPLSELIRRRLGRVRTGDG